MMKCLNCEKEFETIGLSNNRKYCSKLCQQKYLRNRAVITGKRREYFIKDYSKNKEAYKFRAKLHADKARFGGLREEVLKRDGFKCMKCGSVERLEIHHVDNSGRGKPIPNNDLDNLQTLCDKCHGLQTNKDMGRFIDVSKEMIIDAIAKTNTFIEAAVYLKLTLTTFFYKKKQFNISFSEKKQCLLCGKYFESSHKNHLGIQKYCSRECNVQAGHIAEQKRKDELREITHRACLSCGKDFEVNKFNPNQKFCSYVLCGRNYSYKQKQKKSNGKEVLKCQKEL